MDTDIADLSYVTAGGVCVTRHVESIEGAPEIARVQAALDHRRGALFTSGFEYPGRYTRHDMGFVDPPLVIEGRGRALSIAALDGRGHVLLDACEQAFSGHAHVASLRRTPGALHAVAIAAPARITEEERTRQPSLMSLLRVLRDCFAPPPGTLEPHLGLYGAFGYDLVFALDTLVMKKPRDADQRDLVLYLPDELVVVDHQRGQARRLRYTLTYGGDRPAARRDGGEAGEKHIAYVGASELRQQRDQEPGGYAAIVREAREHFARGDLFEVTPSQVFRRPCPDPPSRVMARLRRDNPAPYGFLLNLGEGEYLIGASPEMYVRVDGRRVETCPIAGTVARGEDALADAAQIKRLIGSDKEESELTMCTDVDRNDKARVCEPGSVRVIGRRQIELYSRLIHTVDHVEGVLREGYDGLDAFLTHLWAVTVTGAPKLSAMQFIEDRERSPRRFYGGAVGMLGFDGRVNTGLTLRTIRVKDGVAEVRAGATLLFESDPEAEEAESELKASALLAALSPESASCTRGAQSPDAPHTPRLRRAGDAARAPVGAGKRVLLVDHEDSFVHTLADYFRQTGASVTTLRHGFDHAELERRAPDLVVLSPGPGRPSDFATSALLELLCQRRIPTFGVCLGLQAMAEHFGGALGQLALPVHGKPSRVRVLGGRLLRSMPRELMVGRYHSLFAERARLPVELEVTAESCDDGLVMALQHRTLPMSAVQFHPESILSAGGGHGLAMLENAISGGI